MPPKVSIGMPVFNCARTVTTAIEALLNQTYKNIEIIISDNASTDGTGIICEKYAASDQRVRYVLQTENIGPVANFKFVRSQSSGDYFMWAAGDDSHSKFFIERACEVLDENPDVGLVFCGMATVNIDTGERQRSITGFSNSSSKFSRVFFRSINPCASLIYGLHRRTLVMEMPLERYDYCDLLIGIWYELRSKIQIIPLVLYYAGTTEDRIPYSLENRGISYRRYMRELNKLLNSNFCFLNSTILALLNLHLISKTTRKHNRVVKLRG